MFHSNHPDIVANKIRFYIGNDMRPESILDFVQTVHDTHTNSIINNIQSFNLFVNANQN